jgi:hypothetical protein
VLDHQGVEFLVLVQGAGDVAFAVGFGFGVAGRFAEVAVVVQDADGVGVDDHLGLGVGVEQDAVGGFGAHAPHGQQLFAGRGAAFEGAAEFAEGAQLAGLGAEVARGADGLLKRLVRGGEDGAGAEQVLAAERLQGLFHVGPRGVLGQDGAAADLEALGLGAREGVVARVISGQPAGKRGVDSLVLHERPPALRTIGFQQLLGEVSQGQATRGDERGGHATPAFYQEAAGSPCRSRQSAPISLVYTPMKLGEMLIQLGQITAEQLAAGRQAQAHSGARLGTHLVELGFIGTDQLSTALGRVLGVPAALENHFAHADPSVVARLKPALAVRFQAVPLGFSRKESQRIVAAMADPLNMTMVDDLSFALGAQVEPMVAAELVIARNIKRLYGVDLNLKPGVTVPSQSGASAPASVPSAPKPRPSRILWPVVEAPPQAQVKPPLARPEARPTPAPGKAQVRPESLPRPPVPRSKAHLAPAISLEEALRRLALSQNREALVDVIRDFMAGYFGCGMVFGVREGQARVWRGYAPDVPVAAVETIAFPIAMPSCFRTAHDSRTTFRGPPPADGQKLQRQVWKYLHSPEPDEVLVIPILVKSRVLNLVYAHADDCGRLPEVPVTDLQALCAAASSVYMRMIQRMKGEATPAPSALAR